MKIVVIGGSGLIGKKVVVNLRPHRHEVLAASPSSGVNAVTGEGLAQVLAGAQVVVDVANAPAWEDNAVLAFSRPRAATSWPRRPPRALGIMWRCRLSERTACSRAATSARRWFRKT